MAKRTGKKKTSSSKNARGRSNSTISKKKSHTNPVKQASRRMKLASFSTEDDNDIVKLILDDHKELKDMIETLKDEDVDFDERRTVFEEFAPTLVAHAKPEEETLYSAMKNIEDLRSEGFEGEVEHNIADQLLEEAKRIEDEDEWCANVKVLAEVVEHHIEEEESHLLPDFQEASDQEERSKLGRQFLHLKESIQALGGDDAPSEKEIDEAS